MDRSTCKLAPSPTVVLGIIFFFYTFYIKNKLLKLIFTNISVQISVLIICLNVENVKEKSAKQTTYQFEYTNIILNKLLNSLEFQHTYMGLKRLEGVEVLLAVFQC